MALRPTAIQSEHTTNAGQGLSKNAGSWWSAWDGLAVVKAQGAVAVWANRLLVGGLLLFALSVPHSIFAAHFSLDLSLIAWVVRDLTLGKLHFRRTPLDKPLLSFAGLTILSAICSVEPAISLPKLKTLLLFGAVYLLASNLQPRAVKPLLAVLLISSLAGVGFSLFEKVYGRGMVVAAIEPDSPLLAGQPPEHRLQPGDVIWMIGKRRVYSLDAVAEIIKSRRDDSTLEIEALRAGDPLAVKLTVNAALKARADSLGLTTAGRSRRFRISGFARQFLTYAEQMQILALLCYGMFLAVYATDKSPQRARWLGVFSLLFLLFALALIFTASRAVVAAFLLSLLLVSGLARGRRAPWATGLLVLLLGGLALYVVMAARQSGTVTFNDESTARRLAYMRAGLRVIPQHPWLGVGLDAHKLHWQEWGFPGDYVTHTHSTPIQLALDRGVPALACYVWLLATLLAFAWRGYKRMQAAGSAFPAGSMLGVFGALCGFTASSLVNYNFGDSETLLLLLLLVGLLIVATPESGAFGKPRLNNA
jgi:hypothetical protein